MFCADRNAPHATEDTRTQQKCNRCFTSVLGRGAGRAGGGDGDGDGDGDGNGRGVL